MSFVILYCISLIFTLIFTDRKTPVLMFMPILNTAVMILGVVCGVIWVYEKVLND